MSGARNVDGSDRSAHASRPRTQSELGFTPQDSVRWFDPKVLTGAALKVMLSSVLGGYLDKRELQETASGEIIERYADRNELWLDFVADAGDGFNATYSVAWLVSQPTIIVDNTELPRGELLVFGGDEVYPTASAEEYENRCIGPYRAALPWSSAPSPTVVAVPGNHDWYDGLTSFLRVFTQHRWIGGRESIQDRSYFAIRLPHGHWLWGVDIGTDDYLDRSQIAYFRNAAQKMAPGDRLILCTAMPVWIERHPSGQARNLAFVERELVPRDVDVVLTLTGDEHHYVRYGDPETSGVKITAGGGGAFLSPTHNLPTNVTVPIRGSSVTEKLSMVSAFPPVNKSRWMSLQALKIGLMNRTFPLVTALVGWFIFAANTSALRTRDVGPLEDAHSKWSIWDLLTGDFRTPQTAVTIALLFGALFLFAIPRETGHPKKYLVARLGMAAVHTSLHLVATALVSWLVLRLAKPVGNGTTYQVGAGVLMALASAVVGSFVVGVYLSLYGLFGRHDNESFSAFRHEGWKNFLRIHVSASGIEVHAVGFEKPTRHWDLDPDNTDQAAPLLAPRKSAPQLQLIDHFTIRRPS